MNQRTQKKRLPEEGLVPLTPEREQEFRRRMSLENFPGKEFFTEIVLLGRRTGQPWLNAELKDHFDEKLK